MYIVVPYASELCDLSVGYVYMWTNIVTDIRYIGSHCGNNQKYTAGGILIKKAFVKYGMHNFRRSILYVGPNYLEVEEEILIAIDSQSSGNFYNLKNAALGTVPGYIQSESHVAARTRASKGRPKTEEEKRKNSEAHLGLLVGERNGMYGVQLTGEKNGFYGKRHTEETRKVNSDWHKGKPSWNKGVPMSDEAKRKLSVAQKGKDINPANHNRWHKSRGVYSEECRRCRDEKDRS